MAKIHDFGFSPVGDHLQGGPYRFNVIFVHGLKGHPERTWGHRPCIESEAEISLPSRQRPKNLKSFFRPGRSSSSSSTATPNASSSQAGTGSANVTPRNPFWPEEFLAQDIPEARIWTYGYNSHVIEHTFTANNQNSISQHGRDLAVRFDRAIQNEDPVVFIAHSLGGIIVKDALDRSALCQKLTKLIIFLSTPHRGSLRAGWGVVATNIVRLALFDSNKKLVQGLKINSEILDNIHERFVNFLHGSNVRVHSFQEGRGMSGISGLDGKVVSDYSSKLGLSRAIETVETIDADHRGMTKFHSRDDEGYRAILPLLTIFSKNLSVIPPPRPQQIRPEEQPESESAPAQSAPSTTGPPFFHLPLPISDRFVGRESELQQLEGMLFNSAGHRRAAVVGLGGIGKSQVAIQLADRVKKHRPTYSIFWISALSRASLQQGYASIMKECHINAGTNRNSQDLVNRYLNSPDAGNWLLIIDNADEEEVLFEAANEGESLHRSLPNSQQGRILFTSRVWKIGIEAANNNVMDLQYISTEEARSYLEQSLVDKSLMDDKQAVTELLDIMDGFPLAITQAAAYINVNQLSLAGYVDLHKGTEKDKIELLTNEFRDNTRYQKAQNAVANTLLLSFMQLHTNDEFAERLLRFIACVEPKAIPHSMLPQAESKQQLVRAIGTLCGYGFLIQRDDRITFDMHSLVHAASRAWLLRTGSAEEERKRAVSHLNDFISNVISSPEEHYVDWGWIRYLSHIIRVIDLSNYDPIACDLAIAAASLLSIAGRDKEGLQLREHVYSIQSTVLPEHDPDLLRHRVSLANCYAQDGQYERAQQIREEIAGLPLEVLFEDHSTYLWVQTQILTQLVSRGGEQRKKALDKIEQMVAFYQRHLPEVSTESMEAEMVLLRVYYDDGQVQKSLQLLQRVDERVRVLPESHFGRQKIIRLLAEAYVHTDQKEMAQELLEQMVAMQSKPQAKGVLEQIEQTLTSLELASIYVDKEDWRRCRDTLESVIFGFSKDMGQDHPLRLGGMRLLAHTYEHCDEPQKAIELLEQIAQIQPQS